MCSIRIAAPGSCIPESEYFFTIRLPYGAFSKVTVACLPYSTLTFWAGSSLSR